MLDLLVQEIHPEHILLLRGDKLLMAALVTFSKVKVEAPQGKTLDEMWDSVRIPYREWANIAGVHVSDIRRAFNVLKGNQIILPDGRVNAMCLKYAYAQGYAEMRSVMQQRKKAPEEKSSQEEPKKESAV